MRDPKACEILFSTKSIITNEACAEIFMKKHNETEDEPTVTCFDNIDHLSKIVLLIDYVGNGTSCAMSAMEENHSIRKRPT